MSSFLLAALLKGIYTDNKLITTVFGCHGNASLVDLETFRRGVTQGHLIQAYTVSISCFAKHMVENKWDFIQDTQDQIKVM